MQFLIVLKVLGLLLSIFSVTMFIPGVVSLYYQDGSASSFFIAFAVTLAIGLIAYLPLRKYQSPIKSADGYVIVVMFWTVLGLFGAIPLYIDQQLNFCLLYTSPSPRDS